MKRDSALRWCALKLVLERHRARASATHGWAAQSALERGKGTRRSRNERMQWKPTKEKLIFRFRLFSQLISQPRSDRLCALARFVLAKSNFCSLIAVNISRTQYCRSSWRLVFLNWKFSPRRRLRQTWCAASKYAYKLALSLSLLCTRYLVGFYVTQFPAPLRFS